MFLASGRPRCWGRLAPPGTAWHHWPEQLPGLMLALTTENLVSPDTASVPRRWAHQSPGVPRTVLVLAQEVPPPGPLSWDRCGRAAPAPQQHPAVGSRVPGQLVSGWCHSAQVQRGQEPCPSQAHTWDISGHLCGLRACRASEAPLGKGVEPPGSSVPSSQGTAAAHRPPAGPGSAEQLCP